MTSRVLDISAIDDLRLDFEHNSKCEGVFLILELACYHMTPEVNLIIAFVLILSGTI